MTLPKVEMFGDEPPFGSDLKIANVARVSFDKQSAWIRTADNVAPYDGAATQINRNPLDSRFTWLSPRDVSLIRFLARGMDQGNWDDFVELVYVTHEADQVAKLLAKFRNMPTHWAPFAHTAISLRITAPINPIARQLQKHQIGLVWSEVSRRYVDDRPDFCDMEWRQRAANVKQGSSDLPTSYPNIIITDPETGSSVSVPYKVVEAAIADAYVLAVDDKGAYRVAPEQARATLPQTMMTSWIWTGSLYAFARMAQSRLEAHAQRETNSLAQQIADIIRPWFPVSWDALLEGTV